MISLSEQFSEEFCLELCFDVLELSVLWDRKEEREVKDSHFLFFLWFGIKNDLKSNYLEILQVESASLAYYI